MRKQPVHIIYLTGFGSKYDAWRLRLLKKWRYRNVTVELLPLRWEARESFEQKVARVDQAIDRVTGKRVVLLGESAGGSMAVYMYARRPSDIQRVVTICGKNSHPETVGDEYFRRSPAFREVIDVMNESIAPLTSRQRQNFVSIHPLYDSVVPIKETLLPGCKRVRLWTVGHQVTVVLALTALSTLVVRAARET